MAALVLGATATGCQGGCAGAVRPLPAPLPPDQTIEGGIQARLSPQGLGRLEAALPDLVRGAFAQGLCVPHQRLGTIGSFSSLEACDTNACPGARLGCNAHIQLDAIRFQTPDGGPLGIDTTFAITQLPIHLSWLGGVASCTMNVTTTAPARVVADVALSIDPATAELSVHLSPGGVRMANLPLAFSGCSVLGPILSTLEPLLNTAIGQAIIGFLTPLLDQALQGFLPRPLGIVGLVDIGSLLRAIAPTSSGSLEVRVVPGGYVDVRGGGLSVGILAGLNSDADPATRGPGPSGVGTYHEHAPCVPDLSLMLPDLPRQPTRGTFTLASVPALAGVPEAPTDFAIGISRRFLQMAGFHVVNSGALCLDVGAAQLGLPFNVGTISIVIPSLGNLADDGKAPMRIVLRPQRPVDLDVGTGARDGSGNILDPPLKLSIHELKADLYAFLDQRYVRAFTLAIDIDVGVDLQPTMDAMGRPALLPVLVGLTSSNVHVSVENTALLAESEDRLQMVFPMLTQLLLPVITGQLQPITLPVVGGYTLGDLQLGRVDTGPERFLQVLASLREASPQPLAIPVTTRARVAAAVAPPPAVIRDGVLLPAGPARDEALPHVALELGADGTFAPEWQWRVDGGLWRPYTRNPQPVLTLPEFVLLGWHTIDVRARPAGDPSREDRTPVRLTVLLDSVPPTLAPHVEEDTLVLGGSDLVTPDEALAYEVAPGGSDASDKWRDLPGGRISRADALALGARAGGRLAARVRDQAGNVTSTLVEVAALFGSPRASGGCTMAGAGRSGGGGAAGAVGLALLVCLLAWGGRGARRARVGLLLGILSFWGWGCGDDAAPTPCTGDSQCTSLPCAGGSLPLCGDNDECTCAMDVPQGHIGRFSSLALSAQGALVAAYNDTYGDLMLGRVTPPGIVADWEFVDGVPAGPVVLPQSKIRGGVRAAGDDVGRYTSLAVGADQRVHIAYHDVTHGALRYAVFDGATWTRVMIDQGTAPDVVGWWARLSLRGDGVAGIAYYADRPQTDGSHRTELWYAEEPGAGGAGAWKQTLVASGTIPAPPMGVTASWDLPPGVGLFPDLARLSDGRPVIAYYDRQAGDLVLAVARTTAADSFALQVLDGDDAQGGGHGDVGLYPSIAVDGQVVHVTYQGALGNDLRYLNTRDQRVEVVDDGFRTDGTNAEGLAEPVDHFVGADSALLVSNGVARVAYQDATSHELLFATRGTSGVWSHASLAGSNADDGAFGFFTAIAPMVSMAGSMAVLSSYVINQRIRPPQFYVQTFVEPLGP